jgi:tetratricopeptide (TPR) repeat protein
LEIAMRRRKRIRWRGLLVWALIFVPILTTFSFPMAHAQDNCKTELAEAERKFQEGFFDEAIDLLLGCLNKSGLAVEDSAQAYKLLAKTYHAKQLHQEAREALRKLFDLVPNWRPDPEIDSPPFQKLAEEVIKEVEQERIRQEEEALRKTPPAETPVLVPPAKKRSSKKWLWIGLGTVALGGGAVAVLAGGGNGGGPPTPPGNGKLPDPPGSP